MHTYSFSLPLSLSPSPSSSPALSPSLPHLLYRSLSHTHSPLEQAIEAKQSTARDVLGDDNTVNPELPATYGADELRKFDARGEIEKIKSELLVSL